MNNKVTIRLPQFRACSRALLLDQCSSPTRWGENASVDQYEHVINAGLMFPSLPQRLHVRGSKVRITQTPKKKPTTTFPDFTRVGLPSFDQAPEIPDPPLLLSSDRVDGQLKYFYLTLPESYSWVVHAEIRVRSKDTADRFFLTKEGLDEITSFRSSEVRIYLLHKETKTFYPAPIPNIHAKGELCLGPGVPPLTQLIRSKGTYEGLLHWIYFWAQQRPNTDLDSTGFHALRQRLTPVQRIGNRRIAAEITEENMAAVVRSLTQLPLSNSWLH